MGVGTLIGKVAAKTYAAPATTYSAPSTSAEAQVITWTTHEPTASYAVTVADGSAPTSTELGILTATQNAQITALVADVAALKAKLAALAVDVLATNAALAKEAVDSAAMLAQLNAGE
jgi:hypothetical protein